MNNEYQEREIDLIDVCIRLLEQWKMILVVTLICAILLPLLMGLKSGVSSASVSDNSADGEVEISAETQLQLDNEYNAISSALSSYMEYKSLEYLYQNSILNQVDFMDCITVSTDYEIRISDSNQRILTLYTLYTDIIYNEEFTDKLIAEYSNDAIDSSLYDVCTISGTMPNMDSASDTAILTVRTTLPSDVTVEEWNTNLENALIAYKNEISENVGDHELSFVSTNSRKANDVSMVRTQNQKANEVNTAQNAYKTAYSALSDDNKAIVDNLLNKYGSENGYNIYSARAKLDKIWDKHTKEVAAAPPSVSSPNGISSGFGKKNIALGAILGIILYAGGYFVLFIFSKKIKAADEIEAMFGINNYGSVIEYPYTGTLSKIAHDSWIYNKRNKGTSLEKIAEDLSSRLKFNDKKSVQLIVCGVGNDNTDSILNAQKARLEELGNEVSILKLDKPVSDMYDSEFSGLSTVFLQLISGETSYQMIQSLVAKFKEYHVEIIGSEFVEVRK